MIRDKFYITLFSIFVAKICPVQYPANRWFHVVILPFSAQSKAEKWEVRRSFSYSTVSSLLSLFRSSLGARTAAGLLLIKKAWEFILPRCNGSQCHLWEEWLTLNPQLERFQIKPCFLGESDHQVGVKSFQRAVVLASTMSQLPPTLPARLCTHPLASLLALRRPEPVGTMKTLLLIRCKRSSPPTYAKVYLNRIELVNCRV